MSLPRGGSFLLLVAVTALFADAAAAQTSEPSTILATALTTSVQVDGRLDEEVWERAQHITNFSQRELDFGSPVSERTEVAVLVDADALYIGFWGFDSEPHRILANEMARDFSWTGEDNFEVILDTFQDDRNGYLFVTNPNAAMADALVADNGGTMNRDWDGVWEVRTQVTEEGWFAEIRIPFSTLRYGPDPEAGWGINFERNIRRKREQVLWQGWSRDFNLERVSRAGLLLGLEGLISVRLLDVRPHGVGGVEWKEEGDPKTMGDLGLDVSYLPSPAVRLNLTVNPDFAQVESDREEVNLTRFSLFYPEKREFFLEGQEFFDFEIGSDTRPFYSRRIGLAPNRTEIPILGGGRVLGKWGASTLGAMVLQTAEKTVNGEETPSTNFGVVRWKRDVLDESSVGLLAVSQLQPGRQNLTYGFDLNYATSEMFDEKEFEAGLVLAQTYTSDAEQTTGLAHRLYFSYPNDLVEFLGSWVRSGEGFNPEAGFQRRDEPYQRFFSELAISPRPEFLPFIQQVEIKPFEISYFMEDESGDLDSFFYEFVPLAFTTRSGEDFEVALFRRAERLDESLELLEDAEEIPPGTYWNTRWLVEFGTFSGRRLSGGFEVSGGEFYTGDRRTWSFNGRWKVSKHLTFQGDYEQNRVSLGGEAVAVEEVGGRADFALSPTLFGAISAQWNNEDDEAIFNFRLNWIPRPGSDLFIVVNQQAETWDSRWDPVQTTVLTKLVWRMAF
jgi:hypothetical protein